METLNTTRNNMINICIGVVEDIHGPQPSYEMLVKMLNAEFPELEIRLPEVIDFYCLSIEITELQIMYNNL
jgi:hypothetical protein